MGIAQVGDNTSRTKGRTMGVRARIDKGSQDGVWLELSEPHPLIEFRFTRGDAVVEESVGNTVETYGEQYELIGPGAEGVYYYRALQWRPKQKGAVIVNTKNIGKRAVLPHQKGPGSL